MAKTLWQDKFIIEVYDLARSGMSGNKIAQVLGVAVPTFNKWVKNKKPFRLAFQTGRKKYKKANGKTPNFRDYIFERLPYDLRKVWHRINKLDKAKSGMEKIEAILAQRGKSVRQHLFVYAWVAGNFSISQAMRKVNISRSTFDKWKKEDSGFAQLIEEINWHKKNFFEDHLCSLVAGGDTSAIIFANRTYNRDRGYNEKVDVDMNLSGELDHAVLSVDVLKLPLQTRKEILKSLRKNKPT